MLFLCPLLLHQSDVWRFSFWLAHKHATLQYFIPIKSPMAMVLTYVLLDTWRVGKLSTNFQWQIMHPAILKSCQQKPCRQGWAWLCWDSCHALESQKESLGLLFLERIEDDILQYLSPSPAFLTGDHQDLGFHSFSILEPLQLLVEVSYHYP